VNAEQWGYVVGVKFLVDIQAVCVIFSHGDVVLFHNEVTESGDTVSILSSFSQLHCMNETTFVCQKNHWTRRQETDEDSSLDPYL